MCDGVFSLSLAALDCVPAALEVFWTYHQTAGLRRRTASLPAAPLPPHAARNGQSPSGLRLNIPALPLVDRDPYLSLNFDLYVE